MDEAAFIKNMRSASEVRDKSEVKKLKTDLSKKGKRFADLDLLIKKVYEDNAMGKLPDRRYEMLSSDYEKEQQELEISMKEIRDYNMNGIIILGVDAGCGNYKTARCCFPTSVSRSDQPPVFTRDYLYVQTPKDMNTSAI